MDGIGSQEQYQESRGVQLRSSGVRTKESHRATNKKFSEGGTGPPPLSPTCTSLPTPPTRHQGTPLPIDDPHRI